MKSVKEMPKFPVDKFTAVTNKALEAQLVYTAITLDIFSYMNDFVDIDYIVSKTQCDSRNLGLLLDSLTATGYLDKKGTAYRNLPDTDYYLNTNSEMYIGEHILYWRDLTSLEGLTNLVQSGPDNGNSENECSFDFRSMGKSAENMIYTGRVQDFIAEMEKYFKSDMNLRVLDMGGGSGILAIEFARSFINSEVVVLDQKEVTPLANENIKNYNVSEQVSTCNGNFITDDIGNDYDLIIASGVVDFAGDLSVMSNKLHNSLKKDGYLFISTHGINDDYTAPARCILGWLASHLHGLDILKTENMVVNALTDGGFVKKELTAGMGKHMFQKTVTKG